MNSVATLTKLTPAQRRELLKMARARDLVGDRSELPPIERVPRDERLPLSFAQQGLWFVEQLGSLGATYHLPLRLRLCGELNRDALVRALDGIVARHEALRTVFTQVDGIPEQRVAPVEAGGFHLVETDLAGQPDAEAELGRLMDEEARAPFDLEQGPPIRGHLIRVAADDHMLLLTMHHIVSDGWSLRVLLGELAERYAAHHEGREAELPELPVQYADYAAWQRRWVEGEVLREQADYWTRTLGGAPELLELPTDRPRPAQMDHAGATLRLELDEALTAGVKALARRNGTTLFMTLLTAWAAVLSRLSGQDDVVVGTPTAGRGRPEIEGLIGFFVNMLALRVDLSGSPTVAELLSRVKDRAVTAQRHQDIPFDQVVELVDPVRSLSHSPLFQVVFAWVNAPLGDGISLPGLELDAAATGASRAKFDLSLTMQEAGDRIVGAVEYATALFEPATVERYVGYLRRVLQAMVQDERQAVDHLPLLSPAERWQVVEEWNATEAEYPANRCIHELFEAQAARTPDAVAVRFEEESLTYAELNARANRLAHYLRGRGVGPEVRVGVLVERSPSLIAAVLGVLKAGGAYVPLDPTYPAERLRYVLEDSGARVLVTGGGAEAALAGEEVGGYAAVDLDAEAHAIAREPETPPISGVDPQNLAYIIHTSGSTGRPKGTGVQHRSLISSTRARTDWYGGDPRHFLLLSSIAFDSSVAGVFWTLCGGGALHLMRAEAQTEPAEVVRRMGERGITDLLCVPSYYAALLRFVKEPLPSLARAIVAGEAATWDLAAQHEALLPHAELVNEYGPTEATVWSTAYRCPMDADAAAGAAVIPIGGPIPNACVYVVDGHGAPVPVGVAGELWVGGAGVTRGYLGRPGLTAERFLPDPFSGQAGARLYRTGDRVRWRADGVIDFLGRFDHQVKVRGFRIELGEIEAVLRRHEGVTDCAVMARAESGEPRLVAYVVGEARAEALRPHVRQSLPEYMLPSAFVSLDALPLTPNGKLDRKALPAPEYAAGADRYVAPRTPVEEVLAGIWAEVLRLERVGVEESFFELGGHSLLATRVVSRIRDVFGIEVPLRALFEGPTVAELAGRVEEMRSAGLPVIPPVAPTERTGALPLSFAQERLWFLDRLEPGSAVYNIPAALRVAGALDQAALERSLGEIVRRHEALRTVFAEVDGAAVQVIAPFAGFALPVEDLSALGEADREAAVKRRAVVEARRGFDLSAGPLFRAALLRLGEEDHVLLLTMHHAVSDGWSMGVLFRELSLLYEAYREGRESPLPELPVQYADYAAWQRQQLAGEVLDRQLAYWRERLAGAPELLELPTDRPRPPVQTYRGATVPVELSPELLERLQALGRSEGATLYMTLLGAFQVLLSKYAGSEDVVVGSPIAGRTRGEVEELIGLFVNTLVLRTDLSGNPSFREVLGRVREATLGAYAHQDVPFEKLVAELQPERSMSHSPLFQVLFTLQNTGNGGGALAGLNVSAVGAERATAKFDLSLTLTATAQGLRGELTYSTDLFERATVDRMLGHLERVLEQVAADADVRLSRLELLGEAERALVLETWNDTAAEYPADVCIHELFQAQAERTPDAVAVVFEDDSLTYRELNERANRLAHHLAHLGAGPEARVGICLDRSAEMVVAMLAVLKSGAAYLPLDPSYPADRLAYMLQDSGAPLLVTQGSLRGLLPADGVRIVSVDEDAAAIASHSADTPSAPVDAANAAYVIYTSGSTGNPKGVQVTHRNAVSFFAGMDERVGGSAAGTWLAVTRISFDIHVLELLWTLARGFRVVVQPEPDRARDGDSIAEQIRRHSVTHLQCTPSLAAMMIAESGVGALSGLERILLGGEALPSDLAAQITAVLPNGLVNMYGPTETTVWSATHAVEAAAGPVPIGRPIANTRVYVLDAALRPQPAGVPGELFIGGPGVTRGYLGRPGLTAERFVPDAFSAQPGARLYRTGDRARWTAEGVIEYLGRLDFQVKVRGFRIEPGEIEAVLRRHESVADCVVMARMDAGEPRLVAYVVGDAQAEALRAHVRRSLPEYMVPSAFVSLDALPLTPNGKLDRKALPAPELAADADRYVAPRTPVEEVLAGIWAEVLRLKRVGVEESFFELGGHSLLATRVVSRVREVFGVNLPLRALFEGPTVAELAGRVEEIRRAGLPVLPPVVPTGRTGPLPLSFAQERLWFLDRLEPGSATYNIPVARRLGGALDPAALERALGEIVRRHEALRTVFAQVDGSPVQVITPAGGFALPVEDLSNLGEAEREAAVTLRAAEEAARPFDLSAGPLFRAALLRLGAEDHVLLLTMHHVVSDGWSMGVLFRELSVLYEAYREGRESPLPELPVQYADDAVWQREQLAGEVLDRQLAYWKERLTGAPELLELPTDHPRPQRQDYAGASVSMVLDEALTAGLKALGRRNGTTLFMTLLAGWSVVLSRLSGQEEVVIGTDTANRGRREIEGLIGFFVNTLALRVDLAERPTVAELMEQVKRRALEAQDHQDTPFEQVVELLQPARNLAHNPLFQVHFSWQNAPGSDLELAGLALEPVQGVRGTTAKFDLSLTLREADGRIVGSLTYATALYEEATVERHAGYLRRVLEEMVADDARAVDRLELLHEAERRLVMEEWNRTERPFPAEACVHELFQAQAQRTPDAIALAWGDQALSYRELDARTSRVADQLARLGVEPEERVGVLLERKVEQVLATLAVLKAGGCCVPVDPGYPPERMALMLADAGVRVVVSERGYRGARPADGGAWATLWLEDALEGPAGAPPAPRRRAVPQNLAYLFYTSGSTGRPKGVMMSHREVVQFAAGLGETMPLGPGHRVAHASNVSFDAAVFEFWAAWLHGATLVGLDRDVLLSVDALYDALRAQRITHLYQTAALFNQHVLARPDVYASLEQLVFGAEAVGTDGVRRMLAHGRPRRVLHEYGPTEATVWCTLERVESVAAGATTVPIGHPIPNARAYVLGAAGQPLPVGVAGELCIGGAGVVRGYLGRPALTAERFVPDPFAAEPGARLYRTGDLARWRSDGKLEFLGRNDDQVKVRGFRVEPREIRARLLEHGSVRDAVVVVREDVPGDKRLVGYWVGDSVSAEALRAHLSERLPEYMVPGAYVRMERLPLTPNGKVDRRALPAPEGDAYATHGYEAPLGDTERAVAEIWSEVLGVERVGRGDDFFELGGHSLLVVRVISRIQQVLGAEVEIGLMFEHPVLKELAEALAAAGQAELPEIERVDRSAPLPLSYAQQRLWFLEQLGDLGSTYHMTRRMRLLGALDRDALVRALDRLLARHEALRTTFSVRGGEPEQRIGPETSRFHLLEHDLGAETEAEALDALQHLIAEETTAPFDLERGPLIRGRLVRLAQDDHVLLLTMHHIVSDGWSMGVLVDELGRLYGAFREGRPDPLPALPVQYADYAAWQRRWVEDRVLEAQASYWTKTLSGAPALLELPTDHPRPPRQDHAGARLPLELDETLTAGLKELSRRHGTTLFMTLLAGWAAVLGRLAGQEEVVVGTPTANRGRREIEGLIGFFVNTLAVRVDLSDRPTVAELLGRVKTRALEAQQNQDIPFEQVVELVQPVRSLAHSPLFQVMFTWQNEGGGGVELPGLELGPIPRAERTAAKFDLRLSLRERDGRIEGRLEYATSLFERATVERYVGYLRTVLEQMAADGAHTVDRLELLSEAERALVLEEWNRTEAGYPAGRCIHEMFEAHAARTPQAVALVCEDQSLTYGALNERANQLAHHLRDLGVGPDTVVAMHFGRGLDAIVALLGILKAGGAYLALDPALPPERLAYMLKDSAAAVLVTRGDMADAVPAGSIPVLHLDGDALRDESGADLPSVAGAGDLAYVIYTSGSTGRPKGVAVEHRQLCNYLFGLRDRLELTEGASYATVSTLSADLGNTAVFSALAWGGTLHVIGEDRIFSGDLLGEYFARHAVDCLKITPSHLAALQTGGDPRRVMPRRWLVLGGESSPVRWVDELVAMAPECAVFNHYGPTETTVGALVHRVDAGRTQTASGTLVLGRPLPNYRVFVVDASLRPVPAGVAGELLIGGAGVARGYLGRPGLTARRFVASPFGEDRLYRTGDLCRWRADGTVEFLGRMDQQVKIRGFRVELGEIEAALRQEAGVAECAVVAREDVPGDRRLVAYLVGGADADALRAGLRRTLPDYMVPSAFVFLDQLPLTPNGKVDRRALPAPEAAADEASYVAPRTPVEEVLAELWAELLRAERVGVTENFFALGGHSLLATRMVSRVRELFGVELPLRALFEGPTVAELAGHVEEMRRAELPVLPPVVPAARTEALPLSFAQERLWFIDRLEPGSSVYNVPTALRLRGALDERALERALGEIVRRHEVLRTVFAEVAGSPVQVIAPFGGFVLPVEDLSGLGEEEREAAARRRAGEEARRAFDLSAGPLFRASLLRLGVEDHVLLLAMHHIVSDAWSKGVLFRELSALYEAYRDGRESPLPELAVQYADYAVWQREQVEGEVLDRQLSYWRERLAGAPELLELPTDRPRPAVQTFRGATVPLELSPELLERLQALGRSEGATLYMTLLAAFQVLLSKYSGSEDIVVGSPIAGRTRKEVEELIGFFVNTLVLRTDLGGNPSFREVLGRVREATLGAYEYQEVPFERLVAELQPERSLSHSPLFQVSFTLQNAEEPRSGLAELNTERVDTDFAHAKFDLSLAFVATRQGLRGGVAYSTDLFERGTIVRMLGDLERVLEQVAREPDRTLSRLELLGEAERATVLQEWNRTERPYPRGVCVNELFQAQVRERPEAVALVWGEAELTYQELDARANQLAHHLVRLGVGPEARVGVLLERGVELVVSLLAVLKAGGAYVPLDPGYPAERLRLMLADSSVRVLLSRGDLAGVVEGTDLQVVHLDQAADALASQPADAPHAGVTAENLAYIVYTSGSTGKPKGVMVGHRQIVQLVVETDYVRLRPGDRVAQASNAGFDALTFEVWGAFLNGATLVGIPQDVLLSPPALHQALREERISTIFLTTALVNQLSHEEPDIFSSVREVLFGGQAVDAESVRRLLKAGRPERLLHMYGPTETTTFCLYEQVEHVAEDALSVPLGHATGNQRIYLLDGALNPVPLGVPGEAYVGGAGVSRGYLDRPALTAERFVPDPFATEPGARMYRTGDRMRWRGERKLEFVGRLDGQVKIRGFRIEPGEVESVLSAHAAVREARVVVREDAPGEKRLAAYVVGGVEAEELREHVRQRLPGYMVPSAFVVMEALPLTPNGKLDVKALPAPELASAEVTYVAPRTTVEEVLAGIWAEVLRLERVGVHDSFFDLGGHSLLVTRLLAHIQATFGLEISIRDVFSLPTLEAMAGEIERRIYEDIITLSDDEAEQLIASNLVAGD
jgi:amino acid adenylation domain-containing protein